jgi:hypothetical protein
MHYRKKPVVVEAIQWTGTNTDAVLQFTACPRVLASPQALVIETLEGDMRADIGDWIIRGVKGELYPCKPDIFEQTYEPSLAPTTAEDLANTRRLWADVYDMAKSRW